jgi:hypothetical protein
MERNLLGTPIGLYINGLLEHKQLGGEHSVKTKSGSNGVRWLKALQQKIIGLYINGLLERKQFGGEHSVKTKSGSNGVR